MYKVRVGNDINVQWRIFRNDSPEDFSGKTLRLLMRGTSQTIEVRDYVLEGNVIKWEYKGKDQRGPSTFTFTLIENEGKDDMFTVDKCDVLRLVSCSCQADDDDGRFDMFIDTDIVLPSNGVDGKTPVLETGETQTLEPGSEATSEIVPDGEDEAGNPRYKVNLGIPAGEPFTYDDFTPEQIEGLKKPALDAAAVAEAAADAATKAAANADNAAKTATEAASSANDAADRAGQAAVDAGLAKTAAEEAAERATEAAGAAGSAAEEANAAAESASQTNTEVSTAEQGRVTAEEQRAAAEQTRQTEFSQLKQEAQTATQEANAAAQAANQAVESIEESLSVKQDKTDESLQTTDKTVTGAINEVNQVVKTKQDKLKAGTGVEITSDNTVNVTLDTTVFKVVASLPESPAAGDENKIHLVPAESTEEGNIYTEYMFVNGKWEEFGTYKSEVDLTPYLKKEDAEAAYQKITDNTLATTAKTIVGAINEVNAKADDALKSILYYGIEYDITISSPDCLRIGNPDLHRRLPIHSMIKGCLLNDNGDVVKYLNPDTWLSEIRDGSQGQVMVELPMYYRKFETDGNKRRVKISEYPLPGYHQMKKKYVSAYEVTVQRSTTTLCSVVNGDADYRGGNNNAEWDGTYRSLLGRPATVMSRTNFRAYARKRKPSTNEWNCMTYDIHKDLFWLFIIEYATLNSQKAFNSVKDSSGYSQGGLGNGVTNLDGTKWNEFNEYCPFIPCGYTDELGNGTGEVEFSMPEEYDSAGLTVKVARYRGIENPFGHLWQWTDGINVRISPTTENGGDGLSKVFVTDNPEYFNDSNYDNMSHVGNEARNNAYVKEVIFGEGGEIMPSVVGGGSTTYFCDYHYTNIPTSEALRGVLFGGNANYGATAGYGYACSAYAPSTTDASFGSRLCFIPA